MARPFRLILRLTALLIAFGLSAGIAGTLRARSAFIAELDALTRYYASVAETDILPLQAGDHPPQALADARDTAEELQRAADPAARKAAIIALQRAIRALRQLPTEEPLAGDPGVQRLRERHARPGEAYRRIQLLNDRIAVWNHALDRPMGRLTAFFLRYQQEPFLTLDGNLEGSQRIEL